MAKNGEQRIECVGPKCDMTLEATLKEAREIGWRAITPRSAESKQWSTHVGWCPDCAKCYDVK